MISERGDSRAMVSMDLERWSIQPRSDMCMSSQNIAEAHFVEATDLRNKKIILGVIYRHPNTGIDNFSSEVIGKIISTITKERRECILMGDFDINLLNFQSDSGTANFFNTLSSALSQPHTTTNECH